MLPDDALILLPFRPTTAELEDRDPDWLAALTRWGVRLVDRAGDVSVSLASGRTTVRLQHGLGPTEVAGYARSPIPAGERLVPSRPSRAHLVVRGPDASTPAVVRAAAGGHAVQEVLLGRDPRRRAAFIVGQGRERRVVKCSRWPGPPRGAGEQEQLERIRAADPAAPVPEPCGSGVHDGLGWSVESHAPGVVLARARRPWRVLAGWSVLDGLAAWLGRLATVTASPAPRPVPLRGSARERLDGDASWPGTPGVLCHGDLASGENVLVRGRRFTVIDWETAWQGPPLLDLLPTLCLGAARLSGQRDPEGVASVVTRLARGEHPRSAWLFERVIAHLRALSLPVAAAGPLAALAWGYQSSMRVRHDELLRAEGIEPHSWTSPAELVFDRWIDDPALGTGWPALGAPAR